MTKKSSNCQQLKKYIFLAATLVGREKNVETVYGKVAATNNKKLFGRKHKVNAVCGNGQATSIYQHLFPLSARTC